MEQKMMPFSESFSLKVVLTDTESITASTAVPDKASRSSSGMPNLSKVFISSGSISCPLLPCPFFTVGSA